MKIKIDVELDFMGVEAMPQKEIDKISSNVGVYMHRNLEHIRSTSTSLYDRPIVSIKQKFPVAYYQVTDSDGNPIAVISGSNEPELITQLTKACSDHLTIPIDETEVVLDDGILDVHYTKGNVYGGDTSPLINIKETWLYE